MKFEAGSARYFVGVAFAVFVFGTCFYGLVLYEFALSDITQGFLISVGTLAANFVFGEALASAVGRRAQASFEAGSAASTSTVTTSAGPPATVTVEPSTSGSANTETPEFPPGSATRG